MMLGVRQYAQTHVQTASPVQVIVLLYDASIQSMKLAREGILANNFQDKARFLDRTLRIVGELSSVLDMDRGGAIAADLGRLYDYIQTELTQANMLHDSRRLDGPIRCMSVVREAWQELALQGTSADQIGV